MSKDKKEKDPLAPFREHGIDFNDRSGSSDQADCPFCGKQRSFHVNPVSTQWVCSSSPEVCGRTGNLVSFLAQMSEFMFEQTSDTHWRELKKLRGGLDIAAMKRAGIALNQITGDWMLPIYNAAGKLADVRRWHRGKKKTLLMTTSGRQACLWGAEQLLDADRKGWPVWIAEGEWDGIALRWLAKLCRLKVIVVAVPGARGWKDEWSTWLKGRDITWFFDNDADGRTFSLKHSQKLAAKKHKGTQSFCNWPEELPEGFDVKDFILGYMSEDGATAKKCLKSLRKLISDQHATLELEAEVDEAIEEKRERPASNPSFQEVLEVYNEWMEMSSDLEDALRVIFAITLSTQWGGRDPAWLFLCGPSGSGKTKLLMSLKEVPDVLYHSNVGAKALISGFKPPKEGEDPSLIPKMLHKTNIFKDWTEILGTNEIAQNETLGVFRGAFDGTISRHFGNGEERSYEGSFMVLAGVTNKIHGESKATVGERFLKYQLSAAGFTETQDLLYEIISAGDKDDEADAKLAEAALAFLDRDMPEFDPTGYLPEWSRRKIAAISQIIAMLRHACEWTKDYGQERTLKYKPMHEVGTRIAKQLSKFAVALTIVEGKPQLDRDIYRLVERVAFDTGIGFNLDVIEGMMELGGQHVLTKELCEVLKMGDTSLKRRLEEMELLGLVIKQKRTPAEIAQPGRPSMKYRLSKTLMRLWELAKPFESHIEQARSARAKKGVKINVSR